MQYPLTKIALNDLGELFTEMLKRKIQQKIYPYGNPDVRGIGNKVASGNLLNSISYKVVMVDNVETLEITYADYFEYVNKGRRIGAKRVPLNALIEWIKIRGIRRRDERGRFAKGGRLSLAFAIQQNIFKYGIRPANLYDKTLDSLEDLFDNPPPEIANELNDLFRAIEGDINNLIENTIIKEIKIE